MGEKVSGFFGGYVDPAIEAAATFAPPVQSVLGSKVPSFEKGKLAGLSRQGVVSENGNLALGNRASWTDRRPSKQKKVESGSLTERPDGSMPNIFIKSKDREDVLSVISIESYLKEKGFNLHGDGEFLEGPSMLAGIINPRDRSFKVNTKKRFWYDFKSGKRGDLFALVEALENVSAEDAVDKLVEEMKQKTGFYDVIEEEDSNDGDEDEDLNKKAVIFSLEDEADDVEDSDDEDIIVKDDGRISLKEKVSEIDEEEARKDIYGEQAYTRECEAQGIIPVRYFVRQKIREEKVYLSHMHLGLKGSKALAACLYRNTNIETLVLRNNHIGDKGVAALVQALGTNRSVKSIDLRENAIGPNGATSISLLFLGEVVVSNRAVTIAGRRLSNVAIARRASMEGRRASITLDPNVRTGMREIYLGNNHIGDKGFSALVNALSMSMGKGFVNVNVLDVSGNSISDEGAQRLGDFLMRNCDLFDVDISWNKIGAEGAKAIGDGLRANSKLERLNMSWNGFGDAGGSEVGEALAENTGLKILDISSNHLGPDTCTKLSASVKENSSLRCLHLNFNPLPKDGLRLLLAAIQSNPLLNNVGLKGTALTGCKSAKISLILDTQTDGEGGGEGEGEGGLTFRFNPTGHFLVDLSDEKGRTLAIEIIRKVKKEPQLYALINCVVNSQPYDVESSVMNVDESRPVTATADSAANSRPTTAVPVDLPVKGLMEFDFVCRIEAPAFAEPLDDNDFHSLKEGVSGGNTNESNAAPHNSRDALDMLWVTTRSIYLLASQAAELIYLFSSDDERVEVATMLWWKVVDAENRYLLLEALRDKERRTVLNLLRLNQVYHPKNPTSHYLLNLRVAADLKIAHALLTSTIRNGTARWRNVKVEGIPHPGEAGTFKPDVLMKEVEVKKSDKPTSKKLPPCTIEFDYVEPSSLKGNEHATADSKASYLLSVVNDESISNEAKVSMVGWEAAYCALDTSQVIDVVEAGQSEYQVGLAVVLFSRTIDKKNYHRVLDALPRSSVPDVGDKLGWTLLFNVDFPTWPYKLILADEEDRGVAMKLYEIGVKMGGLNTYERREHLQLKAEEETQRRRDEAEAAKAQAEQEKEEGGDGQGGDKKEERGKESGEGEGKGQSNEEGGQDGEEPAEFEVTIESLVTNEEISSFNEACGWQEAMIDGESVSWFALGLEPRDLPKKGTLVVDFLTYE